MNISSQVLRVDPFNISWKFDANILTRTGVIAKNVKNHGRLPVVSPALAYFIDLLYFLLKSESLGNPVGAIYLMERTKSYGGVGDLENAISTLPLQLDTPG